MEEVIRVEILSEFYSCFSSVFCTAVEFDELHFSFYDLHRNDEQLKLFAARLPSELST